MTERGSDNADRAQIDVACVTGPAPGGTLAEFVAYLEALGRPCALTAGGTQAWVPGVPGELQRFPLECTKQVDRAVLRDLLKRRGIWLASYLLEGGAGAAPNCFDYVCRDSSYVIDRLAKNARRDIRRGLRTFAVRLCTWDELARAGFPAWADTARRHGYSTPAPGDFQRDVRRWRQSPCYEVWGAWQGETLSAWMSVIKIDDWAMIDIARSCTAALNWCPNNALLYQASRRLLVEEKRSYVTYGMSSIQVNVNELSMHKYKIRMGY